MSIVGPSGSIRSLEDESDILRKQIHRMLEELETSGIRDPQLIRYLTEFRLCNESLWKITNGVRDVTQIRQAIIVGDISQLTAQLPDGDRQRFYKKIVEGEKKCLPSSKSTSTGQE